MVYHSEIEGGQWLLVVKSTVPDWSSGVGPQRAAQDEASAIRISFSYPLCLACAWLVGAQLEFKARLLPCWWFFFDRIGNLSFVIWKVGCSRAHRESGINPTHRWSRPKPHAFEPLPLPPAPNWLWSYLLWEAHCPLVPAPWVWSEVGALWLRSSRGSSKSLATELSQWVCDLLLSI